MQTAGGSAILSHLKRFGFSWRRSKALLPVDNDQMILGAWQLRDADRMVPQYLGRDVRWIIAGSKNDDLDTADLAQQPREIAVCRYVDTRMKS
jgi:hypothetical protein